MTNPKKPTNNGPLDDEMEDSEMNDPIEKKKNYDDDDDDFDQPLDDLETFDDFDDEDDNY